MNCYFQFRYLLKKVKFSEGKKGSISIQVQFHVQASPESYQSVG